MIVTVPVASNCNVVSPLAALPVICNLAVPLAALAKSVALVSNVSTPELFPVTVPKVALCPVGLGDGGTICAVSETHALKSIGVPLGLLIGGLVKA